MKIFALCGSLRQDSSNWSLLLMAKDFLQNATWSFGDLGQLPFFQPENQFSELTPANVEAMRSQAAGADLILISTPEYAHGVPGVLKNGLEWLFCEGTMGKPVAVIIGSGQGHHTRDQLVEILTTMDFRITKEETLIVHGARGPLLPGTKKSFEDFLSRVTHP